MGTEGFISVNFWTALFTLLNFLLVLFVGKKFLYAPVMKMIQSRQQEIDDLYADAGHAKEEAQKLQEDYQKKLNEASATADQMLQQAVSRAQSREEEILRKANADAAAIMTKASADIALEKKKAVNDAKNEISGLALAIAGKVVEKELKPADQSAMIDRFIEELGDQV